MAGRKGIFVLRISEFYFQKGNRNEPEPFYSGIPYGEGKGASVQHKYEGGTGK